MKRLLAIALLLASSTAIADWELLGTGTAFVVNKDYALTAAHVLKGCDGVSIRYRHKEIEVEIAALDSSNDLGLLLLEKPLEQTAKFRGGKNIRLGATVINYGYPLTGELSDHAKIARGEINSLAGLGNDSRVFQYDASTQPGNSGGPVLDQSGNVVGVVSHRYTEEPGINFAVKSYVAEGFLSANGVDYERAESIQKLETPDIAEMAETFTVSVDCWGDSPGLEQPPDKVPLGDTGAPIVIPVHNWSSQVVMAYVIGQLFEKLGYSVWYEAHDSQSVYEYIRRGDVTISHEVWEGTFALSFNAALEKGGLIDAGTHAAITLEEVGVPQWVIDRNLCPGLPNWTALKNCRYVFATPDSGGRGRILDGPQSWHGMEYVDRVEALLGDTWVVKFAGNAAALWADHAAAKREGRATLTFNWSPNFTDAEGFVFIEWPPYYPGCRKQDGGNSKCGSPRRWLKKAAWSGMPAKWPAAYRAFTRISFTKKMIGTMASYVDINNMEHSDAARRWIYENENVWSTWLYGP
jgi:glycine betaine/proline transport system substrate-binding protein